MFDIKINIPLKKGTIQFSLIYPGHKMYINMRQYYDCISMLDIKTKIIYVGHKKDIEGKRDYTISVDLCWT